MSTQGAYVAFGHWSTGPDHYWDGWKICTSLEEATRWYERWRESPSFSCGGVSQVLIGSEPQYEDVSLL